MMRYNTHNGERKEAGADSPNRSRSTSTESDRESFMPQGGMTEEHKRALAKGRAQGRAVRSYLDALEKQSKRGPKMDEDALKQKIEELHTKIDEEDNAAKRVELIQKRLDYEEQLSEVEDEPDMEQLESDFKDAVKDYSERKGITYTAWREAGVPAKVLRDAGVPRTRRTA